MRLVLALVTLLPLLAGACASGSAEPIDSPPVNIEGIYTSQEAVGALGEVVLLLRLREGAARTYRAVLHSNDNPAIADSTGTATVGNDHLIVNFDILAEGDYYFEATFAPEASPPDTLAGNFIFPEQTEQLAVVFDYTSALPPPEEPAT